MFMEPKALTYFRLFFLQQLVICGVVTYSLCERSSLCSSNKLKSNSFVLKSQCRDVATGLYSEIRLNDYSLTGSVYAKVLRAAKDKINHNKQTK